MQVIIYQPAKNAMQSGDANTQHWVLEFDHPRPKKLDPLMGWVSSDDTLQQVALSFDTKEEALAYAKRHGYTPLILHPSKQMMKLKSYSDNFAYKRKGLWTH